VSQSGGSDWTSIDAGVNGSACSGGCFAKIAAGGDTLTLTSTNSQDFSCVSVRITGHGVTNVATGITKGTAATGSTNAPNPPNCNPATSKDWLFIETFAADDDDDTATYWSANYSAVAQIKSAASTSSCLCAVASRALTASSDDPGNMAMSAVEEWRAQTFAIPPALPTITANQGGYTLTGQVTLLKAGRLVSAAQGSYAATGFATALRVGRLVNAAQGSYALGGQSAGLVAGRFVSLSQGSYTLGGQAADLFVTSGPEPLVADQGSYALTGFGAGLRVDRALAPSAGSYALDGRAVAPRVGRFVGVSQGAYSYDGEEAAILRARVLAPSTGSYTLTGGDADFAIATPPAVGEARVSIGPRLTASATLATRLDASVTIKPRLAAVVTLTPRAIA
jgi:hypothetical protein